MIQKLKMLILSLSLLFTLSATALIPAVASAAPCTPSGATTIDQGSINCQLKCGSNGSLTAASQTGDNCVTTGGSDFNSVLKEVINVLSVVVGAVAVVMIIIGGFRYVTSAGSDTSTAAARKTILYALVGLVIVALAQVVVHFVLNNIN